MYYICRRNNNNNKYSLSSQLVQTVEKKFRINPILS